MKTKPKFLVVLSLMIAASASAPTFAAAADDGTIAVAPTTPTEKAAPGRRDGKRVQGMLEQRLEQLDKNLQLTADQKEQIKAIWAKEATAAKAGEGKDRRAALKATRDQVRAVLTPDQQAKFDKMTDQRPGPLGRGKKAK